MEQLARGLLPIASPLMDQAHRAATPPLRRAGRDRPRWATFDGELADLERRGEKYSHKLVNADINVLAVNDAPLVDAGPSQTVLLGQSVSFTTYPVVIDIDSPSNQLTYD